MTHGDAKIKDFILLKSSKDESVFQTHIDYNVSIALTMDEMYLLYTPRGSTTSKDYSRLLSSSARSDPVSDNG